MHIIWLRLLSRHTYSLVGDGHAAAFTQSGIRLDRFEGLKQSELAEMLDLQPITLTRLLDRLCDNGLIERRSDPNDRRAKRLFLTAGSRLLPQFE